MESIVLNLKANISFVNALRRLIQEQHKGVMYELDEFVYDERMKTFDVGFGYEGPTYYKTDFDPYNLPETPPTLIWQIRPPPRTSGIAVDIIHGDTLKFSDKKWHFEFNQTSEIAALQPSDYYTDINYKLCVKTAGEDARFAQLNCWYTYESELVADELLTDVVFNILSKNSALSMRAFLMGFTEELMNYLEDIRQMFLNGDSQRVHSIEVDDSVKIQVVGFGNTLVQILMSQVPQTFSYKDVSFKAYVEHPTEKVVVIKIDYLDNQKSRALKRTPWDKLLAGMIDTFIYQVKTTFVNKLAAYKPKAARKR